VAWLASLGAVTDLGEDDGSAAAAAAAAPADNGAAAAATAVPMDATTTAATTTTPFTGALAPPGPPPAGEWRTWREENALQAGRRVRHFYLVAPDGAKTLAVEGIEGGGRHFLYETLLPDPRGAPASASAAAPDDAAAMAAGAAPAPAPAPAAAPTPAPPGAKMSNRAEVADFLRACVRASGGPADGGGDGEACASPRGGGSSPRGLGGIGISLGPATLPPPVALGGAAGAAFAAAMGLSSAGGAGGANATDSGVRKRTAPERFDPRPPSKRTPSPPMAYGGGGGPCVDGLGGAPLSAAPPPSFMRYSAGAAFGGGGYGGAGIGIGAGAGGTGRYYHHAPPVPQRPMDARTIRGAGGAAGGYGAGGYGPGGYGAGGYGIGAGGAMTVTPPQRGAFYTTVRKAPLRPCMHRPGV
jgi:hypothetical protein